MKKVIFLLSILLSSGIVMFGQDDSQRLRTTSGNLNHRERTIVNNGLDHVYANETAVALRATLASPTFTGTVVIPSPFTLGATSVTTTGAKLNYLTGATGTTGTNTTNIVFSTSPTLITPALGTPSALVGTNITGTGASFTAGAVTGFTPASGSLTLSGADAVTLTTTAATNVTLPTTGTLVASSVTDLLAAKASPTFTGTVTLPIVSISGATTSSSTASLGAFGDTQTVLGESSVNTNSLLGVYPMVNFAATAGKVFAGSYNRLLAITTAQTNDVSMFGAEDQFRVKDVNLANGNHAGLWAYAEQSGTTVLSGGGSLAGILATVESAAAFSAGATEHVVGVLIDGSVNAGATINASANFSGLYIKSNGKDWFDGIHITGATNDIKLQNAATIENAVDGIMTLTEPVVAVVGKITATAGISQTATVTEYTTIVTIDSTKIVGVAAGDIGHADGAILVASPGTGYTQEFVSAFIIYDHATADFAGGGNDLVVQTGVNGAQVTVSGAATSANLLTASGDKILRLGSTATELVHADNGAISLTGTAYTNNGGTAAGLLRVHVTYRVHTTGL